MATTTVATKLWPNYFNTTGGVNPAAAVLADPAVNPQIATVRQPPFNIRIASTRSNAPYSDANMRVWATLLKPEGYDTDSCSEARFLLGTATWDSTRFGPRGTNGRADNHWVTQRNGSFDPGMPFGTYTICLRDTNLGRGVNIGEYDNTNPNGGPLRDIDGGSYSNTSWSTSTCNY